MRSEVQQRDFDALGKHLEDRFRELQSGLEERLSQARDAAARVADDVGEEATSATEAGEESSTPQIH
jgi:hypothetical protein